MVLFSLTLEKALAESFLLRKKLAFEIASGTGPENDGL